MRILYQDPHLVAVDKPSGMLVHRGWARDGEPALQATRDTIGRHVYPVHRLDRATSGVLLFALSPDTARHVQDAFQAGDIDKRYLALARGVTPEEAHVDHPVPKAPRDAERVPASTDLRRLAVSDPVEVVVGDGTPRTRRFSLVEARPHTGRTHQIRRHLKHLGHPIVGDVRYGKGPINRLFRERFALARLALHAWKLAFEHPVTGECLVLRAPLPPELAAALESLHIDAAASSERSPSSPPMSQRPPNDIATTHKHEAES